MYAYLKHLHSSIAIVLIVFFSLRLCLRLFDSSLLKHKLIRIVAMILDLSLLVSALAVYLVSGLNMPDWLVLKIILLASYIYFAYYCLKKANQQRLVLATGVLALGSLTVALYLAYTKPALF